MKVNRHGWISFTYSSHVFPRKRQKPQIWHISQSENCVITRKIIRLWPDTIPSCKWSGHSGMPNLRSLLPWVFKKLQGHHLDGHTQLINPSVTCPDNKVLGANMWPIWARQDPGGPHVGPMSFAIWVGNGWSNRWMDRWMDKWTTWERNTSSD